LDCSALKNGVLYSFVALGTTHPTRYQIPEDVNPH